MSVPSGHVAVVHGSMTINVPRDLFGGYEAVPDETKANRFKKMLSERYPWLSPNALDVLMRNARQAVLDAIDEETNGLAAAKVLMRQGKNEIAIRYMETRLKNDPGNTGMWYILGEALCIAGRRDEGYAAFAKGRGSSE